MERTGEPVDWSSVACALAKTDLARIFHKSWKRHYSVFAPHLSPTVLRAASQAALQRENLTSAWACGIFGLVAHDLRLNVTRPLPLGPSSGRPRPFGILVSSQVEWPPWKHRLVRS
jgi:hypothetical protein